MTKKEMFTLIANETSNEEIKAFCAHEIEILSKKRSSVNSKKRAETAERAEKLYNALAEMALKHLAKKTFHPHYEVKLNYIEGDSFPARADDCMA